MDNIVAACLVEPIYIVSGEILMVDSDWMGRYAEALFTPHRFYRNHRLISFTNNPLRNSGASYVLRSLSRGIRKSHIQSCR